MREPAPDPRDIALGAAVSAARLALAPVRLAARMPVVGRPLRRLADELASEGRDAREELESAAVPAVERAVDAALASPLTDAVAHSLAEHNVVERIATQVVTGAEIDRALESRMAAELTDRVLASPELKRAIEEIASSPEVRAALVSQTGSLAGDVADGIRGGAGHADQSLERSARRLFHRPLRQLPTPYGGGVSRAIAFAIDAALANAIVLVVTALAGLAASLVGELRPQWLVGLVVGAGAVVIVGGYFVLFWSVAGQTPGMRVLRLRVHGPDGGPPRVGRSLVRFVGLLLAIVPLFLGFVPVLFDARRRALPDFLAGTAVVSSDEPYPRTAEAAAPSATGPSRTSATHA